MKKYNLSDIMKKAWEIRKSKDKTFSESLKISWKIAKACASKSITFEFVSDEKMTIDMETGIITGKTYNSRNKIKKDFSGKWDGKNWTVDINSVILEMQRYAVVYAEVYLVGAVNASKTVVKNWLVPDEKIEGYISVTKWSDGTITRSIVG